MYLLENYSYTAEDSGGSKSDDDLEEIVTWGFNIIDPFPYHFWEHPGAIFFENKQSFTAPGLTHLFNMAPVVAQCDRKRVLSSWAPYCRNSAPSEYQIEFSSVRHLTPREFVEKLSKELGVRGVVAGESYRFGYKAAGDAVELVKLCEEYGLGACIIKSVMDKNQKVVNSANSKERGQVSSTRVRYALSIGDMKYVSELLGRRHRLILMAKGLEGFSNRNSRVSAPKSCLLNLAPKEGLYNNCFVCTIDENLIPCCVVIDSTHVHIEMDEIGTCNPLETQDYLSVEFGDEAA